MLIVALTISDRASRGEYDDQSGAMIETWLAETITSPYALNRVIIPDGVVSVREALTELCDNVRADLILTTGGTGPAPRDETPEAMQAV
ncbi:MAG: molybdopterin adenylyltransferase, partial [Martelella sp.]